MTYNPDIHVFTGEQLHEHNLNIATKVHQATSCVIGFFRTFNDHNKRRST